MAVRKDIGKVLMSLSRMQRDSKLFTGITQYGLGTPPNGIVGSTGDDVNGDKPKKHFLWGIHRWGSDRYRIGK